MASFFSRRSKASRALASTEEPKVEDPDDEVRVVLIGKTGAGKSSVANTIAGETKFMEVRGMRSGTQKTEMTEFTKDKRKIRVIDTPGVCDTTRTPLEVYREIAKCMIAAAPGPHAILMVLRASERFTDEEEKAYNELRALFNGFSQHLIVVFTRIDELEDIGSNLDDQLRECPPKVRQIIEDAGGRFVCVSNTGEWDKRSAESTKVMEQITQMMEMNEKKIYTNDCLEKIARMVDEESKDRLVSLDEIKREVVEERNPSFLDKIRAILGSISFKNVACSVM